MNYNILVETTFDVEGQVDSITVSNLCEYFFSEEEQIIKYNEQTEDGNVPTTIKASNGCVDILRDSPAMPDMHMHEGDVVSADINTPYGSIPTTCTTKKVAVSLDENGGIIVMEYVMDIGGAISKNRVHISIKK